MNDDELLEAYAQAKAAGDDAAMDAISAQFRAAEEEKSPSIAGGMGRAAVQGVTLGWGDEAEAWARSLVEDATYEEIRDDIRDYNEEFREEHPVLSYGTEFASGMLLPGGAAGKALQYGNRGRNMLAGGAAAGAAAGAGTSTEDTGLGIGVDALAGGALGGVGGLAGYGLERAIVGKAAKQGADAMKTARGGRPIEELQESLSRMNASAPGSALTEAGGDSMQQLANQARQTTAPNVDQYKDFLEDRLSGQTGRIKNILQDETGIAPGVSRKTAGDALTQLRDREAGALYGGVRQAAEADPPKMSLAQKLLIRTDPDVSAAARDALEGLQRRAFRAGDQNAYALTLDDAEKTFEFWHELQSTLRERASQMGTPTRPGSTRRAGGQLGGFRDDIMDELTDTRRNPWGDDYAKATAAFRERSETVDALKDSEKFARMDTADLREMMRGMPADDRAAFATGAVADLIHKISGQSGTANQARNLIKTTRLRENLSELLGADPARRLVERLEDEALKLDTYKQVTGNSATSLRQAMSEIYNRPTGGDVAMELVQGNTAGAVGKALQSVAPAGGTKAMDPGAAGNILDIMMMQDPAQMGDALRRLEMGAGRLGPAGQMLVPMGFMGLSTPAQQEY